MELKGSKTEQNLLKSFAGESQARNRYTMFAKQAKKDGYEQISAIFIETAENELQHAKGFFRYLEGGPVEITATYQAGKVGTTVENLEDAAAGEKEEYSELYPEFARVAKEEGFTKIATYFTLIAKVEVEHEQRYIKLLENIKNGKVFKKDTVKRWKCLKCGYVHEGMEALDTCPLCNHPKAYFEVKEANY